MIDMADADKEIMWSLLEKDYEQLTEDEKILLEQLLIEDDAEAGYFEDD